MFAEERLRPLVEDLRASGPDEVQGDVDTLEQALDEEDLDGFFGGEGGDARNAIADEAAQRCGWAAVDVRMVDDDFEGVPGTIDAGTAVFTATNAGDEGHEMIVFRRQDGVDEGWAEILELDDDEAMERIEFVTATFAPAGEGMETGDGPPHFAEGMLATFTVE